MDFEPITIRDFIYKYRDRLVYLVDNPNEEIVIVWRKKNGKEISKFILKKVLTDEN